LEITVRQETNDRANVITGTDDCLPLSRDYQSTLHIISVAEPLTVGGMSEKVVDETDIHTLHDQGYRQK
jgi:hypothetical protein